MYFPPDYDPVVPILCHRLHDWAPITADMCTADTILCKVARGEIAWL